MIFNFELTCVVEKKNIVCRHAKNVWHGSENMSYVQNIDNKGYEKEAFLW